MVYQLRYATVADRPRSVIHVVRNTGADLDLSEIDELAEKLRERMLSRHGEQTPAVVIVQGNTPETLRLFGDSYAVSLVRAAMFHAAIKWGSIELD